MANWADEIALISKAEDEDSRVNDNGFEVEEAETKTTVFCNVKSVGYAEYFKSQQTGKAVELKCEIHKADYSGEDTVEIVSTDLRADLKGRRFFVLKTYELDDDTIELALTDLRNKGEGAQ